MKQTGCHWVSVCHAHQRNQLFRVALSNGLCREYEYNFEYESDVCSNEHFQSRSENINSGLYGIWIHGLCNTSAVFCQLSQQANWELVITFVSQLTRELMNQGLWIFENHVIIWTLDKEVNMKATFTVMNTT